MGKEILKVQDNILKYKWEFIRRNEQYKKDYFNYKNRITFQKGEYRKNSRSYFLKAYFDSYIAFKYGINRPTNPNLTFKEVKKGKEFCPMLFSRLSEGKSSCATKLITRGPSEWWLESYDKTVPMKKIKIRGIIINKLLNLKAFKKWYRGLPKLHNDFKRKLKNKEFTKRDIPSVIKVELNLDRRKKEIINNVSKIIDEWNGLRKKAGLLCEKRFNYDKYKGYLKVYDLRKLGWSWEKITRVIYKGDIERGDLNYAKKKAKRDYERCKKLTDSGYRQIR